jgi:hypothetical protein
MNRLQRMTALLAAVVALSTISPNRARAEQAGGWCFWACGLGVVACCVAEPELCEVCGYGTDACIAWCTKHFPSGA